MLPSIRKRNKQPLATGCKRRLSTNGNGDNEDIVLPPQRTRQHRQRHFRPGSGYKQHNTISPTTAQLHHRLTLCERCMCVSSSVRSSSSVCPFPDYTMFPTGAAWQPNTTRKTQTVHTPSNSSNGRRDSGESIPNLTALQD